MFNSFFDNENIEENVGKINFIDLNSLLVDTFKEMTNHMEDLFCLEHILEVREFWPRKLSNDDDYKYVSVTLPSSKKINIYGTKYYWKI